MNNSEPHCSQQSGVNPPTTLFDLLYYFPTSEEELKDHKNIETILRQIITAIKKLQRSNVDEIERVCNTNKKLLVISKFLFQDKFYLLVVNLFNHLMLSSKLLNFIVKINVPLVIFRNLMRIMERDFDKDRNKIRINEKDKELQESMKFIYEFSKIEPKKFPRFYANLVSTLLTLYSAQKQNQPTVLALAMEISIEILKNNFTLAAESQILQNIYNKVIAGDVQLEKTKFIMDIIVNYCNSKQTRNIVHGCIDLGKAFARFNNVDSKYIKQGNQSSLSQDYEQKLIKSCTVIEILLSSWSTLIYFIAQKTTLMNFVNGLARKSLIEIEIIKTHILKKIIIRTLTYNKHRMLKSLNIFGYKSNYLNYRGLVLINFLLKNDALYETFEAISNQGELLQSLSSLCLEYFPHISENQKYSKKIIKNIKYPRHYETFIVKEAYKKKLQSYTEETLICLKSFYKPALISYYFEPKQLRNYLIWLKQDPHIFDAFPQQLKEQIEINLEQVKSQSQSEESQNKKDIMGLLANFYKVGIQASRYIPWKGQNLKFAKFLSSILQYLMNNEYSAILTILLRILKSLFEKPKLRYCQYLICTVLDDFGKYLPNNQECQSAILNNYKNDDYAFFISKILLNIDYEKSTDKLNKGKFTGDLMVPKKILQHICTKQGSDFIILEIIQIIKKIYYENLQKNQSQAASLIQIISTNLIYHKNEQIVSSCLQFFEEIQMSKIGNLQRYIKMIKIDKIKMEYHKKKVAYLFLSIEGGFELVNEVCPQLFKEELQNWVSKGSSMLKQYANFLLKEVKRFNNVHMKEKQSNIYEFLGFEEQERQSLINLPWNVKINGQPFSALAEYKMLKQKLKLRVRVAKIIQNHTTISLINSGMNSFGKDSNESNEKQSETTITIRLEEIIKSYQKNKNKQSKDQNGRFVVTKEQVTLFFSMDYNNNFILQKLNINIFLEKKIYRPLTYPHNFIYLLTMTKSGMDFLRKQKVFEKIIEKITSPEASVQTLRQNFVQSRQNLIFLGCYCSGQEQLKEYIQRKDFYDGLMKGFWKRFVDTTNYEIKEICHWVMNVLIKDQDFQIKIKSEKEKKGKFVETKYGGALYYYHYCPSEMMVKQQEEYDSLLFMRQQMPQKLFHQPQFRQIQEILNNDLKERKRQLKQWEEKDLKNIELEQKRMAYQKKVNELKQSEFNNPKVFENILKYMSLINFGCAKVNLFFEAYKKYISSTKFDNDFPNGLALP